MSASAPEAPPFSVTTTGCFIRLFFWMAACIMRAIWSEALPAPAATTISTGLVGSHAPCAAPASVSPAIATANDLDSLLMSRLLLFGFWRLRCLSCGRSGAVRQVFHGRPHTLRPGRHACELQAHLDAGERAHQCEVV